MLCACRVAQSMLRMLQHKHSCWVAPLHLLPGCCVAATVLFANAAGTQVYTASLAPTLDQRAAATTWVVWAGSQSQQLAKPPWTGATGHTHTPLHLCLTSTCSSLQMLLLSVDSSLAPHTCDRQQPCSRLAGAPPCNAPTPTLLAAHQRTLLHLPERHYIRWHLNTHLRHSWRHQAMHHQVYHASPPLLLLTQLAACRAPFPQRQSPKTPERSCSCCLPRQQANVWV